MSPRNREEKDRKAPPIEREHETTEGALEATDEKEREEVVRSPPLVPEDDAQRR